MTYVNTMKSAGVNIYAISAENEPDSGGMNATTSYTAAELATWIGTAMGPALANTGVKIIAPETMNWYGFPGYFRQSKAILLPGAMSASLQATNMV